MVLAVVATALLADGTRAQLANPVSLPNFDVRTDKSQLTTDYLARVMADAASAYSARALEQAASLATLQADIPGVEVIEHVALGTPEVVGVKPGFGFLTGPSVDRVAAMRDFLTGHAGVYGLSATQVAGLELVADYTNPAGNMSWVEFEQKVNGIPVFQGLIRGGFTAQGELARTTGVIAGGLEAANLTAFGALSATQAVARAAGSVGWVQDVNALAERSNVGGKITVSGGTMARDARAWQVYFPMSPGVARLAWVTEVWGDPNVFMIVLDAEDGTVLFRKNLTSSQTQPATYTVYASDSPAPLSPTSVLPGAGTQAHDISRTNFNRVGNETPNTFNNLGWMTDNANGVNGWTEGNNVRAGVDLHAPDGIDVVTSGVARAFNFPYDPADDAPSLADYRNGEVTNQFYWANVHHDRLYLLGFTEAAGNFQQDNFGRGGLQADRVNAEAQDYSGTNNAFFSTPADGVSGRMQMYVFTGPTPDRSSGLDQEVILHELTHGTSNRLHSNSAGLATVMAQGMGEGWSDFYARALLSSAGEDVNGLYAMGAWVTNQMEPGYTDNYYYGIRRFPYAVKSTLGSNGKPHNPLTFADVDATQYSINDGAYPRGPIPPPEAFKAHSLGEIWCMALLEVRARFITRLGYATGNQRILQFVTDGMKLDPINPTFLQGRDAIIAAANAGGGTPDDIADIWAGFAVRGMGQSAQVLNAATGSVVEGFDVPGPMQGSATLAFESIPNGWIDPAEEVTLSICIFNNSVSASGSVMGTLQASGGVLSPSGPQTYGVIPANTSVCRAFTFTNTVSCGGTVQPALSITEAGGGAKNFVYAFKVGGPDVFFAENFDFPTPPTLPTRWSSVTVFGAANPWVTSASAPHTPPNRAFVANPAVTSDNALVTPSFDMPAAASFLTFRNSYATEADFDGGVLEIQIDGGAWTDIITAGGSFVAGGYNDSVWAIFGNPLGDRPAWSGNSGGYVTTIVNMPPAAFGQEVRLRWRLATDGNGGATGWAIDSISIEVPDSVCGGPAVPGAFSKSQPGDAVVAQPVSPVLSWGAASGATGYQYCIDTSHNNTCNSVWWLVGNSTSVALSGLSPSTSYSWHVRATNAAGTRYSQTDPGAFWTFTTGPASLPFGQVDTPVQNAAGVQGAIAVTGWALDDIGVTKVEIFRNCLGFEPGNCQTVLGQSLVYVGDAAFLDGARPDVSAAFPTHPQNNRAGWGYLLLTPMLPHVTNSQPYGGQGALALYAVATDTNGGKRLLGRSWDPGNPEYATPTSLTMTNDSIAKPFGAIDTPGQGATISGSFNIFGWAITPDSNTTAGDGDDIFIPTDGSTMAVFIDSLPVALVAYDQCRGTVGNPVPGGLYCDDDVSNIFGNPTPQLPLTSRFGNPTKFRNLDAGRGAIGVYTLNTATMSNGLHTIAWSVTDSLGRSEGIGSRYFIVSNGALNGLETAPSPLASPLAVAGTAADIETYVPGTGRVWGRTGFDLATPWQAMRPQDGRYAVRLPELGRLELWLAESIDAAYLVAHGSLQALPVGSRVEGPLFGWMPPAGYVGPYEFVFVRGHERVTVTVTVAPRAPVVVK